jgi:hypothetical protein
MTCNKTVLSCRHQLQADADRYFLWSEVQLQALCAMCNQGCFRQQQGRLQGVQHIDGRMRYAAAGRWHLDTAGLDTARHISLHVAWHLLPWVQQQQQQRLEFALQHATAAYGKQFINCSCTAVAAITAAAASLLNFACTLVCVCRLPVLGFCACVHG